MTDDAHQRYTDVILAAFDIQRGDERRLDKRITDAVLAARDAEVSELTTELEHAQRAASGARRRWREAQHEARQLQARIDRVDALHQPTLVMSTMPCPAHMPFRPAMLKESRSCTDCQHSPVMSCTHSKCCEFPCPTHLALFDETPESCTHG